MIKEIKYNRIFSKLNEILDGCFLHHKDSSCYYHNYSKGSLLLFSVTSNTYNYDIFIMLGMNKQITEEQLKEVINERFGKRNKI